MKTTPRWARHVCSTSPLTMGDTTANTLVSSVKAAHAFWFSESPPPGAVDAVTSKGKYTGSMRRPAMPPRALTSSTTVWAMALLSPGSMSENPRVPIRPLELAG
jgi:hypothetical protein